MSDQGFQAVCKVGDLAEGQCVSVEVDGRMIAVFLQGGKYYALEDSCPHQGAPLSEGAVQGDCVTCSWHGWRFSLEDGRWLDSPKGRVRVATYPVTVQGEEILIKTG